MSSCFLILFFIGTCLAAEPTCSCSAFEYEEKLLAKMIRQEFIFEKLKEDMMALQNKVIAKLEEIETEQEAYITEVNEDRETLRNEHISMMENSAKQMQRYTEEFQKLKDDPDEDAVAFFSKGISDTSLASGKTFIFTTPVINEGNGYDKLTGQFTAPIGGLYKFDVQLCLIRGSENYIHYDILANNNLVQSGFFRDYDAYNCYNTNVVVRLETGGNVKVTCDSCGGTMWNDNSGWNTFSGIRIHA